MAVASRRSARSRPLIVVLLLVSVTLIALDGSGGPAAGVRSAIRDVFASVGDSLGRPFGGSDKVAALERENTALKAQVEELRGRASQRDDAQRERDRLVALLGLPAPQGVSKIVTRVIATGTSNFDSSIELGKGSDDGIAVGMPVVTGEGLVGRVARVSGKRSTVLLVNDRTANVGVRVATTGEIALAAGHGAGSSLRLELVDLDSAAKPGDVVVTSGMQRSVYPPGIPVGTITSSEAKAHSLRREVAVEPFVDFDELDNVAVLSWLPEASG